MVHTQSPTLKFSLNNNLNDTSIMYYIESQHFMRELVMIQLTIKLNIN